jgi:hypothetical protein
MEILTEVLSLLPEKHKYGLAWFIEHAQTEQPWPTVLEDDLRLVTKAKGIYNQWCKS